MKEYLQNNYKKIVPYLLVICAAVSVIVTGISAIQKIRKTDICTYHVQKQYISQVAVEDIPMKECFVHEFICVGNSMESLQVECIIPEEAGGTVGYTIEQSDGTPIADGHVDIASQKRIEPVGDYDGVWIDVSDMHLVQGERYVLTMDFSQTEHVQMIMEGSAISVRQLFHYEYANLYTAGILLLMAAALVWLYVVLKKGYGTKTYFVTSLVVGLLVIFLMPPVSQDDEYRHFLRAYMDVAGLEAVVEIPTGGESGLIGTQPTGEHMIDVPFEIDEIRKLGYEDNFDGYGYNAEQNLFLCMERLVALCKAEPIDSTHRVAVTGVIFKDNTSYWPMIFSMDVAKAFGVRDLFLFYAARFGQLLICLIMEVLAMKLAPKLKEMIWLLAFIPNAFLLKASCNPDGLLTSEIMLLAAIIVWMKEKKLDILSPKALAGWVGYLALTYSIMKMKLPYILLAAGLLLYLGQENVAKIWNWIKTHKKQSAGILIGVLGLGTVGCVLLKDALLGALYQFLPLAYIQYIAAHPFAILKLFAGKWVWMWINLYSGMKGRNLLPYAILVFVICMLLKKEQPVIKRAWFALLFAVMVLVIVLVGYTLTPPDYGTIWGIGYRYLLPFMIVGTLCLPAGNEKTHAVAVKLVPLAAFVTMTSTIITYFVGWSV